MGLRASETKLPKLGRRARAETADRLAKALPEGDDADRIGDAAPWAMAAESYRIATHPAARYWVRVEPDGPCRYEEDNAIPNDGEDAKAVRIDEDYTGKMKPVVEESLLFASVRLATLIELAFQ